MFCIHFDLVCTSFRIKSTLNYIISYTQTGFMKERYLGENTRFIYDLMDYTDNKNMPGLLVLIDFEKAFDSMSCSFIDKMLQLSAFGNTTIDWVKILNNDFKAAVLQCDILSEQFIIQRGCRQGDPMAPFF